MRYIDITQKTQLFASDMCEIVNTFGLFCEKKNATIYLARKIKQTYGREQDEKVK